MASILKAKISLYQTEKEIRNAFVQLGLYIVFTIVTTVISLSSPNALAFFFSEHLDNQFLTIRNYEGNFQYDHMVSIEEWLEFTQLNFLGEMNISNVDENMSKKYHTLVLGVPRMRQIRVKKSENCTYFAKLKTKFNNCYPSYSYSNEDTAPYYKGTYYFPRAKFEAMPISGNVGNYNGPGYMKLLSFDKEKNDAWFEQMREVNWIDNGTRLILIEMILYNVDTLLFGTVQLSAEILPTGNIIPDWNINMFPMATIWSPNRLKDFFLSIIFFLIIFYYTSVEIQDLLETGSKRYFSTPNNYIDMIILASAFIMLRLSMERPFAANNFLEKITKDPNALVSVDLIFFHHMTFVTAMAICVFLVWAKTLRFIGFNTTMLQFRTTLIRCTKDIFGFALMFMIVFVAFALYGMLIFGSTRQNFNTFQSALFSMVRIVLGDFQYRDIEYTNRILCPLFYICYVLFISFILLNMFLAIINNTYIYVKQEIVEGPSVMRSFFVNIYKKIKENVMPSKRKQKTIIEVEDIQFETLSMFEYADVTLSNVASGRRDSVLNNLRRPFHKPYFVLEGRPSMEDNLNEDLIRLSERVELLEDLLNQLQANMDRIFGRENESNSQSTT